MGLPEIIEIPCHHVLSNQNDLKLKKGAHLKQFFNINLGIGIIKKTTFLFVFLTYLPVFLLKFRLGEIVGCGIKLCIQWVPTMHTFDKPRYPKIKKYLKNVMMTFSLCFYSNFDQESSLDAELNSASNEYPFNILFRDPATPKTRNTWKIWWWHHHHVFLGIYCFWGSGAHKKYVKWVLVGFRI